MVLTVAVYYGVWHFDFVSWDDPFYVVYNPRVMSGLTAPGVAWAFTTGYAFYWQPLTWLSHMADVQFFGPGASGPHAVNLVLHVLNTLLVFATIRRLTGAVGKSAFVAALFAIHPMHVESVAWIAERKDVLSTLFALLALYLYAGYASKPSIGRYTGVLAVFGLGLMAKPMVVTLPCLLLLVDAWPLRRANDAPVAAPARRPGLSWVSLVAEKLPFLGLGGIVAVVTWFTQGDAGALATVLSWKTRLGHAFVSYAVYLAKFFWPVGLAAFYPYPASESAWTIAAAVLLFVVLSWGAWSVRRQLPAVTMGWTWFALSLVPVVGFVQAGDQAMADRFTYVAYIGLAIAMAWSTDALVAAMPSARSVRRVAATIALVALAVTARAQLAHWRNSGALWQHALDVTSDNFRAELGLGEGLRREDVDAALPHLLAAVRLAPGCADCHNELGLAFTAKGRVGDAAAEYARAIQLDPAHAEARNNYGAMLARQGRTAEAIVEYTESLALEPDNAQAHQNMGIALATQGKVDAAIHECRTALTIDPRQATWHDQLAVLLDAKGEDRAALNEFRAALTVDPADEAARKGVDTLERALHGPND